MWADNKIKRGTNMLDIIPVLNYYNLISTDRISSKHKCNCFVHHDKNPSMTVFIENNTYYCYSCGAYGDTLQAICELEGCNVLQALNKYEDIIANGGISNTHKNTQIVFKPHITFAQAKRDAQFYYTKSRIVDWHIEQFDYMFKRGFTPEVLNKHGVRMTYTDKYRIVCPVIENNHFRGYVKRRTDGEDSVRKYLYNEGFKSAKTLHGNYTRDWVVVTEGYMDWLKLQQGGFINSVALLKWKASNWQIKKLKKVTKYIISALDDTETGEQGTKYLEEHFEKVIRFPFPFGVKDCGDMTTEQMDVAKFILRNMIKDIDTSKSV
jgi:DNA primase